jgi:hypothetical protein
MEDFHSCKAKRADDEPIYSDSSKSAREARARKTAEDSLEDSTVEEEPIDYDALPAAVRRCVEEHLPGAKGFDAVQMQLGEATIYNVVARRGRTGLAITVSPTGELIETQKDIAPSRLPKAVRSSLLAYYPEVQFLSASIVNVYFYEFEYTDEHRGVRLVQLDASGRILQDVDEAEA